MPARLLEMMNQGCCLSEVCAEFCVTEQTLLSWTRKYPEFHSAYNAGKKACEAWWFAQGRINLNNPTFRERLYAFEMARRFHISIKHEHEHKIEARHAMLLFDPSKLTDDQLNKALEIVETMAIKNAIEVGEAEVEAEEECSGEISPIPRLKALSD
jgi:hypothetical protein